MKKLPIALCIFGLVLGSFVVLRNKTSSAQPPADFSAIAKGKNKTTGVYAAIGVSRKYSGTVFVVGRGTLKIGDNVFILNVTGATLSTDLGQEPIPVTNLALPGLISCSPAFTQLTVEVSPGVTTTIRLNECESDNPTLFGTINPCTGKTFKINPVGACRTEFPGKDTIVINKFSINGNVFCSDTSPCVVPDDVIISESKLPVCRRDPASLTNGKITCFGRH